MIKSATVAVALLMLTACNSQSLYTQLTEREANQIMALMFSSGMPVQKQRDNDDTFSVATEKSYFADAMALLQKNGLPPDRYESLGSVFEKEGFVSSPLEERARLNHALSQEISQTLSGIDGVLSARVHLAVPEHDPLSGVVRQSSASVFIKHRSDVNLNGHVVRIKALVVDGIENLDAGNVTVALFPALQMKQLVPDSGTGTVYAQIQQNSMLSGFTNPFALLVLGVVLMLSAFLYQLKSFFKTRSGTPAEAGDGNS